MYVYRLMLPKRDKHRRLLPQYPPAPLSVPYSPIHSSVRIPDDQLRQMTVPVMPAPPACWHLSVPERWSRWADRTGHVLPDTLQSLQIVNCQFDSLQTTINIAAVLPLKLMSLEISVSKTVTDDGALCYLFAHLPPTLSEFQFSVVGANMESLNHGIESTQALVTALGSLPTLTVFKHDWLRIKDVGLVLDALASRPGYATMRCCSLVLHARNTESADLATLEPSMGATLRVEHLDVCISCTRLMGIDNDSNYPRHVLPLLPTPIRSLHLTSPLWTDETVVQLVDRVAASPTLCDFRLNGVPDPFIARFALRHWLTTVLLPTKLPLSITSLTLTQCLPGCFLDAYGATDAAWTFPTTVKHIDLSYNHLMAPDLAFLRPKWPPQLLSLRLAKNKFHTLVTPLPAMLRVLDLHGNPKLSDEPFPEEWIDELPTSLREVDVSGCMLDDVAGRRLMALRRRAGVSRAGHAKLRVIDEGKSWFSPNISAMLRSDVL
ncbi:hypothetical protein GGF31_007302 [Allomyces arbusculus]|nr:hypothetical protein GGF31_007302 [Allomyces arbusculus]